MSQERERRNVETAAEQISDSLLRILTICPDPDVKRRVFAALGTPSGGVFVQKIEERIKAVFAPNPKKLGPNGEIVIHAVPLNDSPPPVEDADMYSSGEELDSISEEMESQEVFDSPPVHPVTPSSHPRQPSQFDYFSSDEIPAKVMRIHQQEGNISELSSESDTAAAAIDQRISIKAPCDVNEGGRSMGHREDGADGIGFSTGDEADWNTPFHIYQRNAERVVTNPSLHAAALEGSSPRRPIQALAVRDELDSSDDEDIRGIPLQQFRFPIVTSPQDTSKQAELHSTHLDDGQLDRPHFDQRDNEFD